MIRRLKRNVLSQLPPKRRQKITFKLKESAVKKELDGLWEEVNKALRSNKTTMDEAFMKVGTGMLSAPNNSIEIYKLLSQLYTKTCEAKIGPAKEYIRYLCDTEKLKFIVFSFHRSMTDAIIEQLIESKVKYIRIDGSTPVSDRPHLVSQFQSDEDTRVAVLSIKAAGVGLTLTAASLVVFAELDWTPGTLEQCEDRVHRIGQKSVVDIHYLVAAGSLDDWVWTALSRKTTVVAAVLNGEKRYLRMDRGTSEQVSCLANADAYVPAENSKIEFTSLLQTQLSGQKTVLDYFSSQKEDNSVITSDSSSPSETVAPFSGLPTGSDPRPTNSCTKDLSPIPSTSTPLTKNKCIVIESDEDEISKDGSWSKHKILEQRTRKRSTSSHRKRKRGRALKFHAESSEKDCLENSQWSCDACTFLNLNVISLCEMCQTPRTKRPRNAGTSDFSDKIQSNIKTKHRVEALVVSSDSDSSYLSEKKLELGRKIEIESDNEWRNKNDNAEFFTLETNTHKIAERMPSPIHGNQLLVLEGMCTDNCDQTASLDKAEDVCRAEHLNTNDDNVLSRSKTCLQSDDSCKESDKEEDLFEACCSYLSNCDEGQNKYLEKSEIESSSEIKQGDQTKTYFEENSTLDENQSDTTYCYDADAAEFPDVLEDVTVREADGATVHDSFQFVCSQHTSRVYVFDRDGVSLGVSFTPLDVEMKNYSELSRFLLHPRHLKLLTRFVRDWSRLSQTKRRLIARSGLVFSCPSVAYEELRSEKVLSKQRYSTKADVCARSVKNVAVNGGTLRVITKTNRAARRIESTDELSSAPNAVTHLLQGFVQALDEEGNPLCLNCQSPFNCSLVSQAALDKHLWQTRLCSQKCFQTFWTKHNRSYSIQQVYSLEHGICQLCNFDSHRFFENIRATKSFEKRAKMVQESKYSVLTTEYKERMVREPTQGLFWNVDHILPVSEGGGECDIDNLRTLCTVCHRDVTRQQNKDRPKQKLRQAAAACQNITTFFRPLK